MTIRAGSRIAGTKHWSSSVQQVRSAVLLAGTEPRRDR